MLPQLRSFFFFFRHINSKWSAEAVEKAVGNRKERKSGHGSEATFNEGTNKPENGRKDVTMNVSSAAPASGSTR
jgi:hypothetical protein